MFLRQNFMPTSLVIINANLRIDNRKAVISALSLVILNFLLTGNRKRDILSLETLNLGGIPWFNLTIQN